MVLTISNQFNHKPLITLLSNFPFTQVFLKKWDEVVSTAD